MKVAYILCWISELKKAESKNENTKQRRKRPAGSRNVIIQAVLSTGNGKQNPDLQITTRYFIRKSASAVLTAHAFSRN